MISYVNKIHSVVGPLIPVGSSVVLLDFPNHPNVGDSAIWLGEERYLSEKVNCKIVAVDDWQFINRDFLKLSDSTIILLSGGGNLGDLYIRHQSLREYVIERYPQNRIIQLPQSIYFEDNINENLCGKIFSSHKDFHLLVRDSVSLALAKRLHDGPTYLCPDMALCLEKLPRTALPRFPIFGLLRTDKEKVVSGIGAIEGDSNNLMMSSDWLNEQVTLTAQVTEKIERLLVRYPKKLSALGRAKLPLYYRLANERLKRGCDLLCSGRVVVTDRLHAHILCTLMEIPHVVLDNTYQKLSNFRKAWQTGDGICQEAENFEEALEKAQRLLI